MVRTDPAVFIDDPGWARVVPDWEEPRGTRHFFPHEDCSRIEPEAVAGHLRAGGTLGRMAGYEERPGQLAMCREIASVFNAREHLMVEAGTGVGKSLAYLLPAIHWAWTNDTPVIVSTATRNLQSQLMSSDIPRALPTLGEDAGKFRVALLKGRANYLCLRALGEFFAPGYWTMAKTEQEEMPHFLEWLRTTKDGDLDGYEGLPRSLLTCPGEECGGRRCPYYQKCFIQRARKAASAAHLVVVNHSLVLAEATNPGSAILPAYGRLVLDEAHNLEEIATEQFSYEFSLPALTRILNRLRRQGKGKRTRPGGILAKAERQLAKGILTGDAEGVAISRLLKATASATVRIVNAAEDVFAVAELLLKPVERSELARYRVVNGVRAYSLHGLFKPYEDSEWNENALFAAQNRLEEELANLVALLHSIAEQIEAARPKDELNFCGEIIQQIESVTQSIGEFANEAIFVLKGERPTHAYWVERVRPPKRPSYLRLVASPLSVAAELRQYLYEVKDSVVLSSATLRVGNSFAYMSRRLGFCPSVAETETGSRSAFEGREDGRYRTLVAESPFDYFRQTLVLAPDCLPDPASASAQYASALAGMLKDLFAATSGRALVLFTSYEMMRAVAGAVRDELAAAGITLLVQGEGLSRETMTSRLRNAGSTLAHPLASSTVLFGAQSFWEGVDVAGEALSCVVLARLPFAQVGDPVIEARSEAIDRSGGSSFRDYALPEAVIRFRQGFGRLIRTQRDRGVVVITDPRIVTKSYGAIFRKSIPTTVHTVAELSELYSRVTEFFEVEG